jgi:hypothetical protein
MSYEEEDTCMSYEEEDTCMSYEEEDTCMSYEEEDEIDCFKLYVYDKHQMDLSSPGQTDRGVEG